MVVGFDVGDRVVLEKRKSGDPPEGSSGVVVENGIMYLRVEFAQGVTATLEPEQLRKISE